MASNPNTAAPPPVEADPERRRGELLRWRQRSRAIHFWRRALPGVIIGVVALLGVWVAGRTVLIKLTTPPKPPPAQTGLRMLNPRFYGRDKSNNAFVLGAAEAARDSAGGKSVDLSAPHLTLGGGDDATRVHADHGVYHEDQRQLSLDGQVQIHSGSGYTFTTPDALVDTAKGEVQGDSGIQGEGPLGHIAASSYGVYDRGKRIIMKGDVHAHIVQ
jgi:lipopolysaccharide export system protein LptC